MDISIIIVNWNVKALLKAALRSIEMATGALDVETIVIDNHSSDGSAEMVAEQFPRVTLIANKDNRGFARANNQGIKIASGNYLFILNPDTELQPDTLLQLFRFMDEHPDIAMVGPMLRNTDGTLQPSCRRFPSIWYALCDHLFLNKLFSNTRLNGYMMGDFSYDRIADVDQPMGAAMFVRKTVVDRVGLMDEHNFVWFDEVDWCFQFKKAGERILFYPDARLTHHQGKSFRLWRNPFSGLVWLKSRHYFIRKNYGVLYAVGLLLLDATFYAIYLFIIVALCRWVWGENNAVIHCYC